MRYTSDNFKRWIEWADRVGRDLTYLIHYKQIHAEFVEVINENLEHIKKNYGVIFCDWVRRCYGVQAAVGIRRHVRLRNDDSISLIKILDQLSKCACQITYAAYLEIYPMNGFEWQKSTFEGFSKDGITLSAQIINQDIGALKEIDNKIGPFVDKVFAHLDREGSKSQITFGDLERAIESFDKVACKYITFFTSKGYNSLKPTIQDDWMRIFTVPFDIRKKLSDID